MIELVIPPTIGHVGWRPNPGRQTEFLAETAREALYGGAAGGGKSDALLIAAASQVSNPHWRAIIIRRTFPELRELMRRSRALYNAMGGRFRESTKEWFFPSGAIVEFGYLKKRDDHLQYQGRQFGSVCFDELTQFPPNAIDEETGLPINDQYLYLLSRLRAPAGSGVSLEVRATCNPGGPGHSWVQARWQIQGDGGATELIDPKTGTRRVFIPARISDNPYLAGTSYERDLNALSPNQRAMLRDGRWDLVSGAQFSEYDPAVHLCNPEQVEFGPDVWRGADDGFNAPACVLWFTKRDERFYVFDEVYRAGMSPEVMAEEVHKRDPRQGIYGAIDSSAFNENGVANRDGTGRGQVMNTLGCRWEPAHKGPNSRVAGANLIHQLLSKRLPDGGPALVISRRCKHLIRTLPILPKSPTDPEDVDTDAEDHAYDALRYGLAYKKPTIKIGKLSAH